MTTSTMPRPSDLSDADAESCAMLAERMVASLALEPGSVWSAQHEVAHDRLMQNNPEAAGYMMTLVFESLVRQVFERIDTMKEDFLQHQDWIHLHIQPSHGGVLPDEPKGGVGIFEVQP